MRTGSRKALLAIAACGSLLAAPAALGDGPCAKDARSFCSDVTPGQGRLQSCLRSHWGELQLACRDYLDRVASETQLFFLQCEHEIFQLCHDVPAGSGQTLACLRSRPSELSPTCRDAVEKAKAPD
jgi:hypothetical protein